jgi:hypothetical protein
LLGRKRRITEEGCHTLVSWRQSGFSVDASAGAGDVRYGLDDRLQTTAGVLYSSVNLDFYGIGGMLQAKYRIGDSRAGAGLGYAFATTAVTFDSPEDTPWLPDCERQSDVGGLTPSAASDSRAIAIARIGGS